jgi:hypothetical protein
MKFPFNPFNIVDVKKFWKSFKKRFSEDYVQINFNSIGWNVYEPFQDTGTDRVITKSVCLECPKSESNLKNKNCLSCKLKKRKITRFVQIKTREVSEENDLMFGYTLKSKDFIPDPRITFLLFSDYTNDFIIFSINDYLRLIEKVNAIDTRFRAPSFKFDNNKDNAIHFSDNKWTYNTGRGRSSNKYDLDEYMNEKGVLRIMNSKIDYEDYNDLSKEIVNFRNNFFFEMTKGRTFEDEQILLINNEIRKFLDSKKDFKLKTLKTNNSKFDALPENIKSSIKKIEKDLND